MEQITYELICGVNRGCLERLEIAILADIEDEVFSRETLLENGNAKICLRCKFVPKWVEV